MRRLGLFAAALLLVASPLAVAQNSPGDACIIQVNLLDNLTTTTIAFDLLFDDSAWQNLTSAIDGDNDDFITASEVQHYETRVRQDVAGDALPTNRGINLLADFKSGAYSGTASTNPDGATNATQLLNFEGPVDQRAGKIVRETWTYQFHDPLTEYENARLKSHARNIVIAWGPEAEPEPENSVAVVETVQVGAPRDWWISVDGERHASYTFESGEGYRIVYLPDKAPREPLLPIPAGGLLAGLAVALAALGRRAIG